MKNNKLIYFALVFIIFFATFSVWMYNAFTGKNFLSKKGDKAMYIYIKKDASFLDVLHGLEKKEVINDGLSFAFTSKLMSYQDNVKPGRYLIEPKMNNIQVIRLLRSGKRDVVKITYNNINDYNLLAEAVCGKTLLSSKIEFDSLLHSSEHLSKYGFDSSTILAMFIPNTYEVYWDESAENLFDRINKEYKKFWNPNRIKKAKDLNLTAIEVISLAAIVQGETLNKKEQKTVAGLYLNRVKQGIKLEADPTLAYISGKSGREIMNIHKEIDSPYNTYMYKGIPPGPIAMPDVWAIDAVLNYESHEYIFMCAKGDGSGLHNFAKTNRQHNINVSNYKKNLRSYKKRNN